MNVQANLTRPTVAAADSGQSRSRTIRVLHITEASCAGVGGHTLDLAEGLSHDNCEVHLMYSGLRIDEPFQERLAGLDSVSKFQIDLKRAPQIKDVAFAWQLRRYLKQYGPFDVVHAHSTKAGGLTRLPIVAGKSKRVYTPNGIFTMNPTLKPLTYFAAKQIENTLAWNCDAIIAVSPEEKQHMLEIGLPKSKIRFVANGIRNQYWGPRHAIRHELGIDQDAIIFGFLGRLAHQKNPLLLINAFKQLENCERTRLAIVGEGPLERECRHLADELNLSNRIDWLGFKTAQQSMPAFDVFVMPSRYEGMPYVMMEAMSIGLPIVATSVGGTGIGIEHNENGFVVPNGGAEQLASAMLKLNESADLRVAFGEASRQRALHFSVEKMVKQTRSLYEHLLTN